MEPTKVKRVVCNPFVKRQTAESPYSHFLGTWEELEKLVEYQLSEASPGYKTGVLNVPVNPAKFMSAIVPLSSHTPLKAEFKARREGEEGFINVTANIGKSPAKSVVVHVYSHDVLQENNEASSDAEYEIVNIAASPTSEPTPMDPVTFARNWRHLAGGTKMEFTPEMAKTMTREEWLEQRLEQAVDGILFYSKHAHAGG